MSERIVIVSGAGSGLGLHITKTLLDQGACVVANYSSSGDALAELGAGLASGRLVAVQGNIAEESVSEHLVEAAGELGGPHAVIHNASITRDALLVSMPTEVWQEVHDVNLRGAFFLAKHSIRRMMRRRAGRLVFVSSISARLGNAGQANYAASKSGLDGLARSISQEYARHNISTCVLAAGMIDVGMVARLPQKYRDERSQLLLGGVSPPERMARTLAFLASDDAVDINATVVHADGGLRF
jgi:3-oxoacyl-[acyl-carrier protein] reductase